MLKINLPSYDLHSFEGVERMIECLSLLQNASNSAFNRIASRMSAISSRISVINETRGGLEAKIDVIEKSEVQYNLKFSSLSRYPTSKTKGIGKSMSYNITNLTLPSRLSEMPSNNTPASSDSKGIQPEIKYEEGADQVNANHSKINQFLSMFEGEYNVMAKRVEGFGRIPKHLRFATSLLISNSNLNPYTNEATPQKIFQNVVFGKKKQKGNLTVTERMISTAMPETMVGQNGQIIGVQMDLGYKPIKKEAEDLMVSSKLKLRNIVSDDAGNEEEEGIQPSRTSSRVPKEIVQSEKHPLPSIKPEPKLPEKEKETFVNKGAPPPPPPLLKTNTAPPPPPPNLKLPPPTPNAGVKPTTDIANLPKPQPNRGSLLEQIRENNKAKLRPISKALETENKELPPIPGSTVKRSEEPKKTHVDILLAAIKNRHGLMNQGPKKIDRRGTKIIGAPDRGDAHSSGHNSDASD